ncbi:unnamed protein product [Calypogeia fissa]
MDNREESGKVMSIGRHSKFTYYSVLLLHLGVCHSPLPSAAAAAIGGASLRTAMRFEERTLVHQVCARFELAASTTNPRTILTEVVPTILPLEWLVPTLGKEEASFNVQDCCNNNVRD